MKYSVKYIDNNDQVKTVVVEGKNKEEVFTRIISDPNVKAIISLDYFSGFSLKNINVFSQTKIDLSTLAFICRQFSYMFEAGLSVSSMMTILIRTIRKPWLKTIFENIYADILAGLSFYRSFSKYEKYFGSLFVNMIRVGETSGNLDKIFASLANYYEYSLSLRNRLINVLIYPIFVIFAVLIVWGIAMFFVVPKFKQIFIQILGQEKVYRELPFITILMLNLSDIYMTKLSNSNVKLGYILYFLKFGLFGIVLYLWKNFDFRKNLEIILMRIPLISTIIRFYYCSIFFKALHTTLTNGILVVPALRMSSQATTSSIFQKKIEEVILNIEQGKRLSDSLISTQLFEPIIEQMLVTGEKSGSIYQMLREADKYYSREMEILMERIMRMVEPVLIVVIGVFVFFILLSLYLPIFILPSKIIR
ncbi:MAG: type II secretion system F family protein [Candidatus Calescibacterium sp.]|nr:type II secretion system F family protein [Candidatus Calescibacterium sp.]MCX7972601.1 type II secretion system F family protein [bacterium]MDW8195764.1 type II secretion system F family protein [Candidatus Calescibacterium sp.]